MEIADAGRRRPHRLLAVTHDGWDDQDVAAWVTSMGESLTDPRLALEIAGRARESFAADADRGRIWGAGVVSDVISTLPSVDPWRNLSARVRVEGGADLVLLGAAPPPPQTGATSPSGSPFGTWQDGVDLVPPAHRNLLVDIGLIALAEPLAPQAAAFMALAASDWRSGVRALEELGAGGGEVFDVVLPALRWAAWRRRVYTGPEDSYLMTTGFEWLSRASLITSGDPVDDSSWAEERDAEVLGDELYEPIEPLS